MSSLKQLAFSKMLLLRQRMGHTLFPDQMMHDVPVISDVTAEPSGKQVMHIAAYTQGNAGDTLLPRTIRDILDHGNIQSWRGLHAHRTVTRRVAVQLNAMDGIIIGGGGLFLRDSNPNNLSGWQWSCSVEALKQLDVPLAVFAVGYNRFRGQPDFKPVFRDHLKLLAEKSVYIGLRNEGSIRAIKSYLPKELQSKVRFQPCPTTLCRYLYPELCKKPQNKNKPILALNCAFDRIELRLGDRTETILTNLANAVKELSSHCDIRYMSHTKSDHLMFPYLKKAGVSFNQVDLFNVHPREVVKAYVTPDLAIGMRGHAQMIPLGCGTPILSLVSHDKMHWFLEDIGQKDWGVEMTSPDFKSQIIEKAEMILKNSGAFVKEIQLIQQKLLDITLANAHDFISSM
jgi:hypothetical protein